MTTLVQKDSEPHSYSVVGDKPPCPTCNGTQVQAWQIPGWPRLVSHLCECAREVRR